MLDRLPKFIEPLALADKNASFEGNMPLNSLERLGDLLSDNEGNVVVKLFFSREGRLAKVEGHISAVLALICQRCLGTVEWPIDNEVKLGIVSSLEQVALLPEGYEPLLLTDDDKLPLTHLIEDELLLGLPTIPLHQYACAIPSIPSSDLEQTSKATRSTRENPFSILADFKKLETSNGSTKK